MKKENIIHCILIAGLLFILIQNNRIIDLLKVKDQKAFDNLFEENKTIDSVKLRELEYYQRNLISVKTTQELLDSSNSDCFIYFHRSGCSYCDITDSYIVSLINSNKLNDIPMFFIDMSMGPIELNNEISITGTPSLIYFMDGDYQIYIGDEEIILALEILIA